MGSHNKDCHLFGLYWDFWGFTNEDDSLWGLYWGPLLMEAKTFVCSPATNTELSCRSQFLSPAAPLAILPVVLLALALDPKP